MHQVYGRYTGESIGQLHGGDDLCGMICTWYCMTQKYQSQVGELPINNMGDIRSVFCASWVDDDTNIGAIQIVSKVIKDSFKR